MFHAQFYCIDDEPLLSLLSPAVETGKIPENLSAVGLPVSVLVSVPVSVPDPVLDRYLVPVLGLQYRYPEL